MESQPQNPEFRNKSENFHLCRYDDNLFDLILYVQSTIFQLNRDESPWVEPVLS